MTHQERLERFDLGLCIAESLVTQHKVNNVPQPASFIAECTQTSQQNIDKIERRAMKKVRVKLYQMGMCDSLGALLPLA